MEDLSALRGTGFFFFVWVTPPIITSYHMSIFFLLPVVVLFMLWRYEVLEVAKNNIYYFCLRNDFVRAG